MQHVLKGCERKTQFNFGLKPIQFLARQIYEYILLPNICLFWSYVGVNGDLIVLLKVQLRFCIGFGGMVTLPFNFRKCINKTRPNLTRRTFIITSDLSSSAKRERKTRKVVCKQRHRFAFWSIFSTKMFTCSTFQNGFCVIHSQKSALRQLPISGPKASQLNLVLMQFSSNHKSLRTGNDSISEEI